MPNEKIDLKKTRQFLDTLKLAFDFASEARTEVAGFLDQREGWEDLPCNCVTQGLDKIGGLIDSIHTTLGVFGSLITDTVLAVDDHSRPKTREEIARVIEDMTGHTPEELLSVIRGAEVKKTAEEEEIQH